MEGPTPVSALIHAATMVAAGVYLVARTYPLFEAVPQALTVVAIIGGFTAIFAASMGLASNDIKRILAFSTVSQLGYMMLALGAGSVAAGMFHLFTHAFFKALLFLCAGSVIHAVGTNDITEMGGLRKYMPRTYWTMLIGALSLVGLPVVLGLLVQGRSPGSSRPLARAPILLAFGVITMFLTGFYTFRMFFLTFHGSFRGPVAAAVEESHPEHLDAETHAGGLHESDGFMTIPLIILAIPAALIGFWGSPLLDYGFQRFLEGPSYEAIQPDSDSGDHRRGAGHRGYGYRVDVVWRTGVLDRAAAALGRRLPRAGPPLLHRRAVHVAHRQTRHRRRLCPVRV